MIELPKAASRGRGRAHRVFHPLSGADLSTLLKVWIKGGSPSLQRCHVPWVALASALGRLPFTALESLARHTLLDTACLPAPIFVVGYWRSGTTHFANVLSRWQGLGMLPPIAVGLPHEALGLARLAAPFIEQFYPKTRLIDPVPLGPELPQEDELALANMSSLSFYHGIYFPRHAREWIDRGLFFDGATPCQIEAWKRALHDFLTVMTIHQGRRPVLVRNPAHSARVPLLRSLWPNAKFIHLYRDPYVVQASASRMFRTLFRELALQESDVDTDDLVLRTYPRMLTTLLRDAEQLPAGSFAEVQFEAFERDPIGQLRRIFDELGLEGFGEAKVAFAAYLETVKSYRKADHHLDVEMVRRIEKNWQPVLQRWSYPAPSHGPLVQG
ncbi:MAG TPA: sulfotransferase [Geminicoccus sp.]|uniref:sulfotransferase family protein n=1 Tax=Geminicoccus sp. TaxID=2024832 RepID=UPI002E3311E6|nr:sulfotransferase [Geminicoccus sp.]HEX2528883.1 sulfotransferase [Geminicoccus sp.]